MNDIRIITELLDTPIAFNPTFARILDNNLSAGMLLSQLFYWAKVKSFGEFYKKSSELQAECFLGRFEFESARKKIIDAGIFTIVKKGVPCTSFYQINLEVLFNLIYKLVCIKSAENQQPSLFETDKPDCSKPANQIAGNQQTRLLETSKLDCSKPANKHVVNQQTIINNREYTETTTENTTNNKAAELELTPESEINLPTCNNSGNDSTDLKFDYSGFDDAHKVAIDAWFTYRKEAKKKYKTKSSLTALRNKMLELKAAGLLIEAINHSIAMEYTGLFPPTRNNVHYGSGSPPKRLSFNYTHDFTANKPDKHVDTF